MSGVQIGMLALILLVIPTVIGMLFAAKADRGIFLPFSWVSGQILLWAGFLVISIPLILLEKSFTLVVILFDIYTVVLLVSATTMCILRYKRVIGKSDSAGRCSVKSDNGKSGIHKSCSEDSDSGIGRKKSNLCRTKGYRRNGILWLIFGLLLLLQLILTVCMAYEEGDDAFYVAISTITDAADNMYQLLPYTGTGTGLDARHGLAPFPIWVAYLARTSGVKAVTVAQVVLPLVLILMAYGIYYLIAIRLFDGNRKTISFFMIVTEVLVLFGGYSVFSAENFLLVRASQGKAVIANIIISFLLYMMLGFLRTLQEPEQGVEAPELRSWLKPSVDKVARIRQGVDLSFWMLLGLTMMAGCLCSTLGTMLTCMFLGIVGVCTAVAYRRWQHLLPMALCCVIPASIAILYFFSV